MFCCYFATTTKYAAKYAFFFLDDESGVASPEESVIKKKNKRSEKGNNMGPLKIRPYLNNVHIISSCLTWDMILTWLLWECCCAWKHGKCIPEVHPLFLFLCLKENNSVILEISPLRCHKEPHRYLSRLSANTHGEVSVSPPLELLLVQTRGREKQSICVSGGGVKRRAFFGDD